MNFDNIELDLILDRKKYPYIYSITFIIITNIIIFLIISLTCNYKTYYKVLGKVVYNNNYLLEIPCEYNKIEYIINNDTISINNKIYNYNIINVDNNVYVTQENINYLLVYLSYNEIPKINNLVLEVKILKENKKIIYYILDYLKWR